MSLSTVTALNERSISGCSRPCSTGAAIGASVKTKLSIVAIAGAIIPEPLAMPEIETVTPSNSTVAVASLGIGVGGHDRLGGVHPRARAAVARRYPPVTPANFSASSGSPMTPVEARKIVAGSTPSAFAACAAETSTVLPALHAGEGIGIARIDQQPARNAAA